MKSIDKNFKVRFSGNLQYVSDYKEFEKVKIGDHLIILGQGRKNEFTAFFEGRELTEDFQRVFLQHNYKLEDGPKKLEGTKVVAYKLPFTGKIRLNEFEKGRSLEYPLVLIM